MARFPSRNIQDTPVVRAYRAIHKIKSELMLAGEKARSLEMSRRTFDELRKLTKSITFDLSPAATPDGSLGMIDGVPINENNAIRLGDAFITYKE